MKINGEVKEFLNSLRVQSRVIHALMMREIITRFGRKNLGFLWLFLEPMLFTVGIMIIWNLFHATKDIRFPIGEFAFTGYTSLQLWRSISGRCFNAIEPNLTLFYHRNVKLIDVLFSRFILEFLSLSGSFVFLASFFVFSGIFNPLFDIYYIVIGWLLLSLFGLGLGLFIGSWSEISEVIRKIWGPVSYFSVPISGMFFLVEWLPESFKQVVLYVPMVSCVELIRYGFFGNLFNPYYDIGYVIVFDLFLIFIGLFSMKYAVKKIKLDF